jgi:NDP-4-keto-2,6-dideoxyhexose 3-C-methyltransferase
MNCRICKSNNLIEILSLGEQYLSEFRDDDIKPPKFPLDLMMCGDCKQVQLSNTVPQNLLYTDNYGYRSGINDTMKSHLRGIVYAVMEKVGDNNLSIGDSVVDIGSNDGTLLKNYPSRLAKIGYDLVPKFGEYYEGTDITFINRPFSKENFEFHNNKAKVITAISMFYDLDDPVFLLKDMGECLDDKGIIVIQQNYLLDMLRLNGFENCCHEHIFYHSVHSMKNLVDRCGLDIFDVEVNDLNGGSFRTYICHKDAYKKTKNVKVWLKEEDLWGIEQLGVYKNFKERIVKNGNNLRDFIQDRKEKGRLTYVLGASTRGNTLLQYYGLDNSLIPFAIERNPEKWGKKIASVGIPIISEEQARKDNPAFCLVLPWFFKAEIAEREAEYIKKGGKLIIPLPQMEVIDGTMLKV